MASQNVIITGAASGVGLESARRLGANGHGIVLVDVREDALSNASETLSSEGVSVVGVVRTRRDRTQAPLRARVLR